MSYCDLMCVAADESAARQKGWCFGGGGVQPKEMLGHCFHLAAADVESKQTGTLRMERGMQRKERRKKLIIEYPELRLLRSQQDD